MKNKAEVKVRPQGLPEFANDDFFYRKLAIEMVEKMPIEELQKLMKFNKIVSKEDGSVKYEAECELSDTETMAKFCPYCGKLTPQVDNVNVRRTNIKGIKLQEFEKPIIGFFETKREEK